VFQALIASGPQAELGVHRFILSAGIHGALIAGAIALTRDSSAPTHTRPPDPAMLFLAPTPANTTLPQAIHRRLDQSRPLHQEWQLNIEAPNLDPVPLPATVPTVAELLQNTNINTGHTRFSATDATPLATELLTAAVVDDPVGIIDQPAPRYPAALANARVTGRVELAYVVDPVGRVEPGSLHAVVSTHHAFEAAARESVLASRYRPARFRGRLVRQLVRQTFTFRLGE
jgi:TonB family protein